MTYRDSCIQLLMDQAKAERESSLWLADDNVAASDIPLIAQRANTIITNRYHLFLSGQDCNSAAIHYSDFDFSGVVAPQQIYYRVSKEKPLTHYLINKSFLSLPPGGELHVCGFKNDGIKTYIDKAKKLFGERTALINGPDTAKYACLKKHSVHQPPADELLLDDKDYQQPRAIFELNGLPVESKPGVFGWNKQDAGSAFLIEHLGELLASFRDAPADLLDLGCGYGYLSLQAFHRYPDLHSATFVLADNNAAAVHCARANLQQHGITGKVIDSDCANQVEQQFDLILCNPPFHQGFDVSQDITSRFLQSTSEHLRPDGKALFVVNQFIGLEKKAAPYFSVIKELARNKSFKLIILERPKKP